MTKEADSLEATYSITLEDVTVLINLIDACAERGSFKGSELLVIGNLREKLVKSINAKD